MRYLLVILCSAGITLQAQSLLQPGMIVMTNLPLDTATDPVLHVYDTRNAAIAATPGGNWSMNTLLPSNTTFADQWKARRMGAVFGVTIDKSGNIYASAGNVYGPTFLVGTAGWGGIYKINAADWSVTDLVTTVNAPSGTSATQIPNTGCGLGNINYDKWHDQLFVSNFEDGKIYRISTTGTILSCLDPFLPDNGVSGEVALSDRPWGLAVYQHSGQVRLYFSNWSQDVSLTGGLPNTIWSIALDPNGDFTGTAQLEITVPAMPTWGVSSPVSCINFSSYGKMLLAERSMYGIGGVYAHTSRCFEYTFQAGSWSLDHVYQVGNLGWSDGASMNSAGGADFGYNDSDPSDALNGCEELIWATGDALRFDDYNPDNIRDHLYGLAGIPESGNSVDQGSPDFVCSSSYYIDLNNDLSDIPKSYMGSCAVFRNCQYDPCEQYACSLINVLTPNQDGVNDQFRIDCIESEGWKLEVYDRWGAKVYASENYANDWSCAGLTEGVYYYLLASPCADAKTFNGFFHLLR